MPGNQHGALKTAAQRLGLTLEEYQSHLDAGEKWCHKCRKWKTLDNFNLDRARGDGRKAICRACMPTRKTTGPGKQERQQQLLAGFAYCRKCHDWLLKDRVHGGLCKTHINADARQRYAHDPRYRSERRQHAHSRKRGTAPIPPDGQTHILGVFEGKCAYCNKLATTWDHVIPISKGGETSPENIVPACPTCNSSKGDRDWFEWVMSTGRSVSQEFFDQIDLAWCILRS